MSSRPPVRAVLAALALALPAATAHAWDRDTHVAIVNAAMRISPAAAARVPAGQRDALARAAAEPDMTDRECQYHPSSTGPRAPSLEAERALERLRSGKGSERPYARAQSIGRYLHYVADCAMPASLVSREHPYPANELFSNRSFIVFYEGRPLTAPLGASLADRGREALWGDAGDGSLTTAFRIAVNLTVEALFLLPGEPGMPASAADGPVLFLVNAIDNGLGTKKVGEKTLGYTKEETRKGTIVWRHYVEYMKIDPASGRGAFLVSEQPGLHILEWNPKVSGGTAVVRALLFNNDDTCAGRIILKSGRWEKSVPVRIGPRGVRAVEIDAPADLSPESIFRTWTPEPCQGPVEVGKSFPTSRRVIVGLKGQVPAFDEAETRVGK